MRVSRTGMTPKIGVGGVSLIGFSVLAVASWSYILLGADSGLGCGLC